MDYREERRQRTREIKKLLALKYGYKNLKVRYDRGTAHNWILIGVTVYRLEKISDKAERNEESRIREEIEAAIVKSGIKLAKYWTDYGPENHYENCLSIEVKLVYDTTA